MPRTLAIARVTVLLADQPEYLRVVGQLAALSEGRGRRLWVFRLPERPDAFLECSESRSRELHRAIADKDEDEQRLERRLRELARYAPDAWELWEEVAH